VLLRVQHPDFPLREGDLDLVGAELADDGLIDLQLRQDVKEYLKWAFVEAGNSIAVNAARCPQRHVSELYRRLRARKGHAKAIGAVARHVAEAVWHVWSRQEAYRDPALRKEGGSSEG